MNSNQRSEMNNQTDNGANEKWTPGSKGKTTDGPNDHTHPAGAAQQQGGQDGSMGSGQNGMQGATQGGGQAGPRSAAPGRQSGSMGSAQSATPSGTQGGGQRGTSSQAPGSEQSTDRSGSQTGAGHRQGEPAVHESNDVAGGLPKSPGGANRLAADQKMDDDTGLSNTVNRQPAIDEGSKQVEQSNVGRRDDMTPD
jgi:hypothetical protein